MELPYTDITIAYYYTDEPYSLFQRVLYYVTIYNTQFLVPFLHSNGVRLVIITHVVCYETHLGMCTSVARQFSSVMIA